MYSSQQRERDSFRYAYCEVSTAAQGLLANVLHFTKVLYAYEMHFFPPIRSEDIRQEL